MLRLLQKFKDYMFEKRMKKQRYKRGYSDSDCWSMNYWLTETFPKMFITLRNMKHGAPELEFEEFDNLPLQWVNEQSFKLLEMKKQNGYEEELDYWGREKYFDRWLLILTRIAWCLEQASEDNEIYNEYKDEYFKQVWGSDENKNLIDYLKPVKYDKKGKPKLYELKTNEPDEKLKELYYKREEEIYQYKCECKDEAMDLIKKYFYNLWD